MLPSPLSILSSHTHAATKEQEIHFLEGVRKLYRIPLFKPLLDLVTTKADAGELTFEVKLRTLTDAEEGHCLTIETPVYQQMLHKMFRRRYRIMIRKISAEVIMHEIAHAIEKESGIDLAREFMQGMALDFAAEQGHNPILLNTLRKVMFKEVAPYQKEQRNSELFARYFQLLAMSREADFDRRYNFSLQEIQTFFTHTTNWFQQLLIPTLLAATDPAIRKSSEPLVARAEELTPDWRTRIK